MSILDLIDTLEPETETFGHIYRANKHELCGMDLHGDMVFGITLVIVSEGNGYDPLAEEWCNLQAEAEIELPKEGLIIGAYYESYHVVTSFVNSFSEEMDYKVCIRRVL